MHQFRKLLIGVPNQVDLGDNDPESSTFGQFGLRDQNGNYDNAATVTFDVHQTDDAETAVVTGTGTLTNISGSQGRYQGFTSASMAHDSGETTLLYGNNYYLYIRSAGKVLKRLLCVAVYDEE